MSTTSAGTHRCVLGMKLDIFWRVQDPVKHHNQFRVTQCSDLHGLQQWCRSVKHHNQFRVTQCSDLHGLQQWCRSAVFAAATLATAPAAEAADAPLTVATGWDCQSGSLECTGSAVPEACMHVPNVAPGLTGNLAPVDVPQHEDELEDFASMMFEFMPGNDDPSSSLSREGALVTVQSAPSNSAPSDSAPSNSAPSNSTPTAKRVRSDVSGPDSSSQPVVSLACHTNLLRPLKHFIKQSLGMHTTPPSALRI